MPMRVMSMVILTFNICLELMIVLNNEYAGVKVSYKISTKLILFFSKKYFIDINKYHMKIQHTVKYKSDLQKVYEYSTHTYGETYYMIFSVLNLEIFLKLKIIYLT